MSARILLCLVLLCRLACAETVYLMPVADTSLNEYFPSNNLGGLPFFNVGTSERSNYNRGLLRFDLTNAIPPGAKITRASLYIEILRVPQNGTPASSDFGLHRLLVPWGEGDKISPTNCTSCASEGSPATTNEATWTYRLAFTTNTWTIPGGAPTNDFIATPSSSTTIYGINGYDFASTPKTVADAQSWLDYPGSNFGWLMLCQSETTLYTARRVGSREDPENAPTLRVDYTPFRIENLISGSNQIEFSFAVFTDRTYTVQFRDVINSGGWQTLTQFAAPPSNMVFLVTDSLLSGQRFYRLMTP